MSEFRRVYAPLHGSPTEGPDVVVISAASRDLAADDPRGWRLGGSATYCSLALARLGSRVGCLLGVDAEAAEAAELGALERAGVALRRVPLAAGPVFENIEHEGRRRQRWLSKSDVLPVAALPAEWRSARAFLLVPIAGEVGEEWPGVAGAEALMAVGWQGLLREFRDDGWVWPVAPGPSTLLRRANLVLASRDDISGEHRIDELRALAPQAAIVLTAGDRGGVAFTEPAAAGSGARRYDAIPADVVDATGAGDTFLAALVAAWQLTGELATGRALRFAAAAASCAVEGVGLAGVPGAAQVAGRLVRKAPG